MPLAHTPTFHLIAGPNGAGKSTYFDWAISQKRLPDIQQVNGDVIYKLNPGLTQDEVATIVKQQIREHCEKHETFSAESNLATESSFSLVSYAQKKGYSIHLHFISIDAPIRCRSRVEDRVLQGGHDVPYPVIEQRYHNGLSLIRQHYAQFDQIDFYDNTAEAFQLVLQVVAGRITWQAETLPGWAVGLVKHIAIRERLLR